MSTDLPTDDVRWLVSNLTGVPEALVLWDGEGEPAVMFGAPGTAGKITLNVISRETLGVEEVDHQYDEATRELTEEFAGQRVLTISCRADAFQGLGAADDVLERLRIRLMRRSSRKALRAVGLAFVDATSITSLNYEVDQRAVSSANLDIRLAQAISDAVDNETADPLDKGETVEKVTSKSADEVPDVETAPVVDLQFTQGN